MCVCAYTHVVYVSAFVPVHAFVPACLCGYLWYVFVCARGSVSVRKKCVNVYTDRMLIKHH